MIRILIVAPLFLLSANAFSINLYVQEGMQGSVCSKQNPCGGIQDAVDLASAGDVILIGSGKYRDNIYIQTSNLTLQGRSKNATVIESAGGRDGAVGNAGNPMDAIIEIKAVDITISNLSLVHPLGKATKRDAAIFAWAGSDNLLVNNCVIERKRDLRTDEPTIPGSRGVFILLSNGGRIENNQFRGNYQDHVHLPTGNTVVINNTMQGASRAGLSVMHPDPIPNFPAKYNEIRDNIIMKNLDDGIHIQGDFNTIANNTIINNGGYGIYLCGSTGSDCYPPGANAESEGNIVSGNIINNSGQADIGDFGIMNVIQ